MSGLFDVTKINGMSLSNRFVRSATWEGLADSEGASTPGLVAWIDELARGGVGLIITSHTYVRRDGQAVVGQLGLYDDGLIPGFRELTRAAHAHQCGIVCQISHGGYFSNPKLTGMPILAPSSGGEFAKTPREEMSAEQIREIVDAFAEAARRAREAGFDGVQIHAAHGYLMSQFLSPAFNRRQDAFGGSLENRSRALLEAVRAIRDSVGWDYPLLIKLNSEDCLQDGLTLSESLRVGALLRKEGADAIEVSGGTLVSGRMGPSRMGIGDQRKEAYFRDAAMAFKKTLDIPILLVGGNRSFHVAEMLLREGYADYISMSRPFIREPGLVKRWATGDLRKAECLSDNQCFSPGMAGEGVYCVTAKKSGK